MDPVCRDGSVPRDVQQGGSRSGIDSKAFLESLFGQIAPEVLYLDVAFGNACNEICNAMPRTIFIPSHF
jgi:hypothetical protein